MPVLARWHVGQAAPVLRGLGWTVLIYVVLFWRLGDATFWDPDEAHYAQTTRELLASGDWLAPTYNGEPFFDKPVLFHLLQAVPMAILGPTELAARLVPSFAALALVGITGWLGAAVLGYRVGAVAALLVATSPGVIGLARYAILDSVFVAFLFGGVALVTVSALRRRAALQYPGYILLACAVLTKGPLAIALCGLTFGLAIGVSGAARRQLLRLRFVAGLMIVIMIGAPWFVYMWRRFGDAFVDGYVFNENFSLFTRPPYANQPPWWFYLQIVGTGMLPWTGVLVGRAYDDLRALLTGRRPDVMETLLWSWVIAVVGFFTFSQFKLDHYVFPVVPALALLCARAWTDLRDDPHAAQHAGARTGLYLVGPLLVAAGLVACYLLLTRFDLPAAAFVVPAAVTIGGGLMIVQMKVSGGRPPPAPVIPVAAAGIVYACLLAFAVPVLEQQKVVPDLARWVAAESEKHPDARIAAYRLYRWNPAWRFYVARHTYFLDTPEQALPLLEEPAPIYCAMLRSGYDELVAAGAQLRVVYEREGLWATSGRGLWRSRPRPTQFVIVTH